MDNLLRSHRLRQRQYHPCPLFQFRRQPRKKGLCPPAKAHPITWTSFSIACRRLLPVSGKRTDIHIEAHIGKSGGNDSHRSWPSCPISPLTAAAFFLQFIKFIRHLFDFIHFSSPAYAFLYTPLIVRMVA